MTNAIICFLCSKEFKIIKAIILHFKVSHCLTVRDIIQCKQRFCRRKFESFCGFKQHLIRKHRILMNEYKSVLSPDKNFKPQKCNKCQFDINIPSIFDSIPNFNIVETIKCDNYTVENIADSIEHQCSSFCAKLYANPVIPRSQVQFLIENVTELLSIYGSLFRTMLKLENEANISNENIIVKMISLFENSFQNLLSEKLCFRYFENSHYLIQPLSYYVGSMSTCKISDNNTSFNIQPVTTHFIPLRQIFKYFFDLPDVLHLTLKHIKEINVFYSKDIFDFLGSPLWREILKNYANSIVIPIFLFFDDFEINNPLGSHVSIHKLGAAYILLAGIQISSEHGLRINYNKTKMMIIDRELSNRPEIRNISGCQVVDHYIYLGADINNIGNCEREIRRRIQLARSAMSQLERLWRDRNLTKNTKINLVRTLVFPVLTYASETWTVRNADRRRIEAMEMWCWRKMLRIPWTAHRTNISVLAEIGPRQRLSSIIYNRILNFFGHITRSKNMEKLVLQDKADGKRKRGRSPTRWTDTVEKLLDTNLEEATCTAERRDVWRNTVRLATSVLDTT